MQSKIAKGVATISALVCGAAGLIVDLGTDTHVFNPTWPPHARYHDVMLLYVSLGIAVICLWLTWSKTNSLAERRRVLTVITCLLGLLWTAFFAALLVPGSSAITPGMPQPLGIPVNLLSAIIGMFTVPAIYVLERRAPEPSA